jgi:hypothetical protein
MMKLKVLMSIIMVVCFSIFTAGATFANSDAILEKQKEIDTYVFEEHSDEIAEKGITVTHTSPGENAVEIGITPYNEDNADYFYGIFGKEKVKVVEGIQATTMGTGVSTTDVSPMDSSVGSETNKNMNTVYLSTISLVIIAVGAIFAIRLNKRVKG